MTSAILSIQHFPQELIDLIIDHLHDDKRSLSACSLVSKAWLPASRFHLATDITATFNIDLDVHPHPEYTHPNSQSKQNSEHSSLPLLVSKYPHSILAPYIRTACLTGPCARVPLDSDHNCDSGRIAPLPLHLLNAFPGVRTLTLEHSAWVGPQARAAASIAFQHLTSLVLTRVQIGCVDELREVFASFPHLQNLELSKTVRLLVGGRTPTPKQTQVLQDLRTLTLDGVTKSAVISLLLAQKRMPRLRQVHLRTITSHQRPLVDEFLRLAAPHVEELTLDFARPGQAAASSGFSLAQMHSLRTIRFENLLMYTEFATDDPRSVSHEVLNILSTLPTPNVVENIQFDTWILNGIKELEVFDWDRLSALLLNTSSHIRRTEAQFVALREVQVRLHGVTRWNGIGADAWIKKQASSLTEKEILKVECKARGCR